MKCEAFEQESAVSNRPTKASVGRGVLWSAGGAAGTQLAGFIAFLLIARALDPETFGLVALAALFVTLLSVLVEQGFVQAIVQRLTLETGHLDTAFWANLGLSIALAVLLLFIAEPLSEAFDEPKLASVVRALSLSPVIGAFSGVQTAILQRTMQFKVLTTRALLGTVVGGALGVGMAWTGYGVWALVAQTLVSQCVTMIGLWGATGWRPGVGFSFSHLRELWSFGLNIMGSNLVTLTNRRAADLIIGVMLGKGALGLYSVSSKLQTALSGLLIGTITRVFLATLSRLQREPETFCQTYLKGVRLTAGFTFPAFVGIAMLSEEIVHALFGSQWVSAGPLIFMLSFLGLPATIGSLTIAAITSLGYPHYNFRLDVAGAIVTVTSIALAARWGVEAVALAFLLRAYVFWPLRMMVLRYIGGPALKDLGQAIWGAAASSLVMAVALHWATSLALDFAPIVRLVVLIVFGASAYIAALSTLTPGTLREATDLAAAALGFRAVGRANV